MASIKLFTIIILSLAVACETATEKVARLRQEVSPFLEAYTDFSVEDASLAVAKDFNDFLMITSDPKGQEWLDFLTGEQDENPDMTARGDSDLDEAKLTKLALEKVDEMYPHLTPEVLKDINEAWQKEGGYMTMLPYALNHYSTLVQRFYLRQLFRASKAERSPQGQLIGIEVNNNANQALFHELVDRIREYATHFKTVEDSIDHIEGEQIYLKNVGVDEKVDQAEEIIRKSFALNHERFYEAYHTLRVFQGSIPYYVKATADYLWAYAAIAKPEQAEELTKRLTELSKMELILAKNKISNLTPAQVTNNVVLVWSQNCKAQSEELENWRQFIAPKIYGAFLKLINDEIDAQASLTLARSLVRQCLPTPLGSIGGAFVLKESIADAPFTGESDGDLHETLKAWDFLFELNEKKVTDSQIKWWNDIHKKAPMILSLDAARAANLQHSKSLFSKVFFANQDNQEFFKTLYKLVLAFLAAEGADIDQASFAENLDAYLNRHARDGTYEAAYLPLKIYIANMIPGAAFQTKVEQLNGAQVSGAEKEFNGANGKGLLQAFNKLFTTVNTDKNLAKAGLDKKIAVVSGKEVHSSAYTVMSWGKKLLV